MRHGKKFNTLGRTSAHRKQMLSNMAASLITHKRIHTTVPKAKALRKYVEPLITRSKTDNTHSRRIVFKYLQDKDAVNELFRDVAQKIGDRPGGYVRIVRMGYRQGDNAEVCMIELVDYNELMLAEKEEKKKEKSGSGKRRRRRGSKKKGSGQQASEGSAGTASAEDQGEAQLADQDTATSKGSDESSIEEEKSEEEQNGGQASGGEEASASDSDSSEEGKDKGNGDGSTSSDEGKGDDGSEKGS